MSNPIDEVALRSLFEKDTTKWERTEWDQFEAMVDELKASRQRYIDAEATKKPRAKKGEPVSATYD